MTNEEMVDQWIERLIYSSGNSPAETVSHLKSGLKAALDVKDKELSLMREQLEGCRKSIRSEIVKDARTKHIKNLEAQLSTHRALISRLTQALERYREAAKPFVRDWETFKDDETLAEHYATYKPFYDLAKDSRTPHLGERDRAKDEVIEAARKLTEPGNFSGHAWEYAQQNLRDSLHRLDGCEK